MPLSAEQRAKLEAEAKRCGIKPADLIAAAETEIAKREKSPTDTPADGNTEDDDESDDGTGEPGSLFMYLLPFVTVGEVRRIWLKVPGSLPGADDNENAAGWAAKVAGAASSDSNPEAPKE